MDGFRRPLRGGLDAGCDPVVSPPANFRRPSGPFTMNARLNRHPRRTPRAPRCRGTPSSGQFPRTAFMRRFPCVRCGSRLSAAQNPPPVFPRKTSAGGFGLAQGIEFTEEHALFRFRQFLHRFDDFGDGAHGPKLWHALAVSGKGMKKLGIGVCQPQAGRRFTSGNALTVNQPAQLSPRPANYLSLVHHVHCSSLFCAANNCSARC